MRSILLLILAVAGIHGYTIEVIKGPTPFTLGEAPYWDDENMELVIVDINKDQVIRYVPSTGEFYSVTLDGRVSPVLPIAGSPGFYIVGVEQEFKILEWDGRSRDPKNLTSIVKLEEPTSTRINDGKCDPNGRLFAGTYDSSGGTDGNLYRIDSNGSITKVESGVKISNGLAWSGDNKTMYYVDSPTRQVDAFDYDLATGVISNRRVIFTLPDDIVGSPDGMTIDTDDNIWVCVFGGSVVLHVNPSTGTLLGTIDLSPYASQITSAAFGGSSLETLYVTSARLGTEPEPASGAIFAVNDLGVKGVSAVIPFVKNF